MNRKSTSLFTLSGVSLSGLMTVVILHFSQISSDDKSVFCGHLNNAVLDQELPVSHPVNRCAKEQSQKISWSAWFTGRSSSYQFHFIDLLELLSRSSHSEAKSPTQTN